MSMTEAQFRAYERIGITREQALLERLESIAHDLAEFEYDEREVIRLKHDRRTTLTQLKRERGDLT